MVTLRLTNPALKGNAPAFALNTAAGIMSLEVSDMLGRELYTRITKVYDRAGKSCEISWDGVTSRGATVKTGVYFVQCRCGNSVQTQKLVVR